MKLKIKILIIALIAVILRYLIVIHEFRLLAITAIGISLIGIAYLFYSKLYQQIVEQLSNFRKKNNLSKNREIYFRHSLLTLLADVITIDNKLKTEELEYVKDTIHRHYKTKEDENDALDEFKDRLKNKNKTDLNETYEKVNKNFNQVAKFELVMELLAAAHIDNDFITKEDNHIQAITRKINITQDEYKCLKALFKKKKEQECYMSEDAKNKKKSKTESKIQREQQEAQKILKISEKEAFEILGVDRDASDEGIKIAFEQMLKFFKKDRFTKAFGNEVTRQAKESVKIIEEAWKTVNVRKPNNESGSKNSNNSDFEEESNNDGAFEMFDFKTCILILLSEIMSADDKQLVCELDSVKSIIRRHYDSEEKQKLALKLLQHYLNNDRDLKSVYYSVNKQFNYAAKSELIMELLSVAYSDNYFQDSEKKVIKDIWKNLNITEKEYRSIFKIFNEKFRQGQYKDKSSKKSSNSNTKNDSSKTSQNDRNDDNQKSGDKTSKTHKRLSVDDAYEILGVDFSTPDAEVKKAYRALAVKYHPDNAATLGDEAVRQATESMKQINEAWQLVKMARQMR